MQPPSWQPPQPWYSHQPQRSPRPYAQQYKGWILAILVLVYTMAILFLSIEVAVTGTVQQPTDTTSSHTTILGSASVLLFLVLHGFLLLFDRRSFLTLFGRIVWRRLNLTLYISNSITHSLNEPLKRCARD